MKQKPDVKVYAKVMRVQSVKPCMGSGSVEILRNLLKIVRLAKTRY